MDKKQTPFYIVIFVVFFSYLNPINAMQAPLFSLEETSRPPQSKHRLSIHAELNINDCSIRLRNIISSDITKPDQSPGPFSIARKNEDDSISLSTMTQCRTELLYTLYWSKQLETGPNYNPLLPFVLEDISDPSNPIFLGYFIFEEEDRTNLNFMAYIQPDARGRKLMTFLGPYLVKIFLPTLCSDPSTSQKMRSYQTLTLEIPAHNPHIKRMENALERFSKEVGLLLEKSPHIGKWRLTLKPARKDARSLTSFVKRLVLSPVNEDDAENKSDPTSPRIKFLSLTEKADSFA
ncbi:MAG: hypothetical protein JSS34_01210 [Proteobacteria bacterium]|nr:hypothetical protein [Pseudomonadota bacterium]